MSVESCCPVETPQVVPTKDADIKLEGSWVELADMKTCKSSLFCRHRTQHSAHTYRHHRIEDCHSRDQLYIRHIRTISTSITRGRLARSVSQCHRLRTRLHRSQLRHRGNVQGLKRRGASQEGCVHENTQLPAAWAGNQKHCVRSQHEVSEHRAMGMLRTLLGRKDDCSCKC